ncbi:uncharacterized protein F5147DRAFT_649526 [Suillus discolor]|uniref:Uncharacterized protein n=1 Tax=Suillus discolor TaxID=1912936 RepID=A0A9P7FG27_9AGAM|nr:uncharacterized protein F5147DRAFT_649526 [Suillus discolor]KAG2115107.1 hypothetical protein F5147DRAFT_649526 [Suillus discolor]
MKNYEHFPFSKITTGRVAELVSNSAMSMAGRKRKVMAWMANLPWKKRRVSTDSYNKENEDQTCADGYHDVALPADASNGHLSVRTCAGGTEFCTPQQVRHALDHWFGDFEVEQDTHHVAPFFGFNDISRDEDDMIAIQGICWHETEGPQPLHGIIEQMENERDVHISPTASPSKPFSPSASVDLDGRQNEMDDETDDEYGGNKEGENSDV